MTKRVFLSISVALLGGGVAVMACSGADATISDGDAGADAAPLQDATNGADVRADTSSPGNDAGLDAPSTLDASDGATGTDAGRDTGTASDAGIDAPAASCGAKTCTGGSVCCVVRSDGGLVEDCFAGGCPDGGGAVQCESPAQCSAASPICCAHLELGAGTPPNCPLTGISSACQAQCTTTLSFVCPANDTVRLCAQKSDCAGDPQNPNCCTFQQGGQQVTFCASNAIAQGGTCHP